MYKVDVSIPPDSVALLNGAQMRVTLSRTTQSTVISKSNEESVTSAPTLAWVTFAPLQSNRVSWDGSQGGFMTSQKLALGTVITPNSETSGTVQLGWTYAFANGVFTGSAGGRQDTYNLLNNQPGSDYSFGLADEPSVNSAPAATSPFCFAEVLYNLVAQFEVLPTVYIFLSSVQSGVVIASVPTTALEVQLTDGVAAQVGFNSQSNQFYLISS